jgi:hypothetical protein
MVPGRPGLTGRLAPPATDQDLDPLDGPASGSGGLLPPADAPRGPFGRPSPTPQPPLGAGSGRHSGAHSQEGIQRPSAAPSGSTPLIPGFGDPLGDREARSGNGLIDPDEPTEGIRLLQ